MWLLQAKVHPIKAPGRWARKYPELGQEPLSVAPYIDLAIITRKEKAKIFKKGGSMSRWSGKCGAGFLQVRRLDCALIRRSSSFAARTM